MRIKVGIYSALALLLGANSFPFLFFDFGKSNLKDLKLNLAGGGVSSNLNPLNSLNWKNNNLKVSGTSTSHLNLEQKSSSNLNVESLKLENSKEIDFNSLNLQKVNSSEEDIKTISGLKTEINKEAYSLEIQGEIGSSLSSAMSNLSNDSTKSFKKVVEEAKQEIEKKSSRSRGRRDLDLVNLSGELSRSLNFKERQSVSTFYKEFSNLKGKEKELKRRLEEIEQGKKPTKQETSNPGKEALDSLEKIGWNKGGKVNFQKFVSRHWWDSGNPYAHIIDPQQWETLKQVYQGAELTIKEVKGKGSNRFCSATLGLMFQISDSFCYKEAQEPERIKKRIEDLIPIQVLDKLLKEMNLINKEA